MQVQVRMQRQRIGRPRQGETREERLCAQRSMVPMGLNQRRGAGRTLVARSRKPNQMRSDKIIQIKPK